ncbi:MAG TPA: class I SAM-dependent methyltransferase [Vicinamibacterales bacterium]
MSEWTEEESAAYRAIAHVAVPRRSEMLRTLVDAAPFARDEPVRIVEIGSGEGLLSVALLTAFPAATLVALDGSASMRAETVKRTADFDGRVKVRDFALHELDWWDVMFGADLVVSSLCLHHLNDAKKQYLYKAAAERMSPRGAFLVADVIEPTDDATRRLAADVWDRSAKEQAYADGRPELFDRFSGEHWNYYRFPDDSDRPSALFHHLVWLKHAGFAAVDCVWLFAGHAVFGGFKRAAT